MHLDKFFVGFFLFVLEADEMFVEEGFGGLLVQSGILGVVDMHGGIEAPDFLFGLVFNIILDHG